MYVYDKVFTVYTTGAIIILLKMGAQVKDVVLIAVGTRTLFKFRRWRVRFPPVPELHLLPVHTVPSLRKIKS